MVNHGCFHHLLKCILVHKLWIRIIDWMLMILPSNFREMFRFCSILLHMFNSCISKDSWCKGWFWVSSQFSICYEELVKWYSSICKECLEWSCKHLFKTKCKCAVNWSTFYLVSCQVESTASGWAVIIDINHWDSSHTNSVQCSLPTCWVSIHISYEGWLYSIISDVCIS